MADMKRREILLAPRGRIEVLDLEALRNLAEGEPGDEQGQQIA